MIFNLSESTQWILICAISLITYLIFYIKHKQTYWQRQGVDGPKPKFLIGNVDFSKPVTESTMENYKRYGKIYGTYNWRTPNIFISDTELIRQICVKDFHIFPQGFDTSYLSDFEKNMLGMAYGSKWKRLRNTLSPTFTSAKMRQMFELIKLCNSENQKEFVKLVSSKEYDFDPKNFWGRYNLDVISKVWFATSLDTNNKSDEKILECFVEIMEPSILRLFFLFSSSKWVAKVLKISIFSKKSLELLRNLIIPIIENRKKSSNKKKDFLQLLIDAEVIQEDEKIKADDKKLTPNEIVSSVVAFWFAGYETTSTLLTWSCYRMATNPDIQEKLYQEISNANIEDYDVLNSLPYLEAVISETLRIDPPVLIFQRVSQSDYVLPGTSVKIEKGTTVNIPVYAIHHDPENYPEPEAFNPNRFIEDKPQPFTFIPFGAGPRTCIGMRFALLLAKLSLATLVRDYHITTTNKTPNKIEIVGGLTSLVPKLLLLGIEPRY